MLFTQEVIMNTRLSALRSIWRLFLVILLSLLTCPLFSKTTIFDTLRSQNVSDKKSLAVCSDLSVLNSELIEPFTSDNTGTGMFILVNGDKVKHAMMCQFGEYGYLKEETCELVKLQYVNNLSLYAVLPKQTTSISDFLKGLDIDTWRALSRKATQRKGVVSLPQIAKCEVFKFASTESAGTFRLTDKKVQESSQDGNPSKFSTFNAEFDLYVNRPFIFIVANDKSEQILLAGIINDPR
jgi:serine protease inhibitor